MLKTFLNSFVIVLLTGIFFFSNSYSQNNTEYNLFRLNDGSSVSNYSEIKKSLKKETLFKINSEELQRLCDNKYPEITLNLPYSDSHFTKINLQRADILTPNAKIVARTANGNEELNLSGLAVSYTGKLEGLDNSLVSVTFDRNNVTGLVITNDDNYILGCVNDNAGKPTDDYILYKESDMKINNTFQCSTEDNMSPGFINEMREVIKKRMNEALPTDLYVAEIAIEIDFATYNLYDTSVVKTTNYALALMAASSAIYMKEVNVKFMIPYLRVWTTADPYTGTTSNALLNQFRNEWNSNQANVNRTLAHFITRRNGNLGGIAWLNVLCSNQSFGNGYGFSNTDGPILPLPTYSWDVMVVSHEIGHNFGSNHTHNCGWVGGPIDSCYATEGGCYTGPEIPRVGTIMSYCHLNGSISLVKGFGPQPKAILRNGAEFASCMYVSARPLLVAYPNGGELLRTGSSTQIYWGTSLTGNVNIELLRNNGTWQTIANNVPATQRIYDYTIPYIATNLQSKIRILSSSDPNIGDTCDAPFLLVLSLNTFSVLSPPSFTRIDVSPTSTETQQFVWQRAGTNPSIRYSFKIKKLGTSTEYKYISDNNGADTTANVRKSYLDSLAGILGTTGDSVRCTWRATGYNGYDSSSTGNSLIIVLNRTTVGINVTSTVVPDKFSLGNNYPNPFNPSTTIRFDIAKTTNAKLRIYDSKGSEMNLLVNANLQPGSYEYTFDAGNLPSGVYFYTLSTSDFTDTKRMVLLK